MIFLTKYAALLQLNKSIGRFSQSVSSVAQSCPTLCDPMNSSTPGLPVHHQLPEFTQTHVHRVSDTMSVQSCNGDTKSLREKNVLLSDKWLKGKYRHYFPMLWFMTKLIFFPSHNYSPDKQVLSFSKFRNTVFLCQIWNVIYLEVHLAFWSPRLYLPFLKAPLFPSENLLLFFEI